MTKKTKNTEPKPKKVKVNKEKESKIETLEVLPPHKHVEKDVEPSWYHYGIIILAIVGAFFLVYFGFEIYDNFFSNSDVDLPDNRSIYATTYVYPYVVGNITYNINFYYTTNQLDSFNYVIEPDKLQILNTAGFTFVYKDYIGEDNGRVTLASTKFMRFLRFVYNFRFSEENFVRYGNYTCDNSTLANKLVVFDPYQNETGVFFDTRNGCITIQGSNADNLVTVTDKFIYELTKQ